MNVKIFVQEDQKGTRSQQRSKCRNEARSVHVHANYERVPERSFFERVRVQH